MYKILIDYSRPGGTPKLGGIIKLQYPGKPAKELVFYAQPTGKTSSDWSVYTINDKCGSMLEQGTLTLSIRPNYPKDYQGIAHFMNLRSVSLQLDQN